MPETDRPELEGLFGRWCDREEQDVNGHGLVSLSESDEGRERVFDRLTEVVRAHYDDPDSIADDIEELGYEGAAEILREQLPETASAKSGDMGEILATEFVNEETDFVIPILRLRFKDGRNMALRGDDLIGIQEDDEELLYLKGEVKSRQNLTKGVVAEARKALNKWNGRPSAHSLIYVAKRLLESADGDDKALGRKIRNATTRDSMPDDRIQHLIFVLCGNDGSEHVTGELDDYDGTIDQLSVCFRIEDHGDFIAALYEEVLDLGDD